MDLEVLLRGYQKPVVAVGAAWLAYHLLKILYNLFLHPLRSIPGPRLAAATYLPEFYHDVVRVGRYTAEICKMHDIYGPIVRINPNEVHCNDPEFMEEIYAVGGRKRDKPLHQVNGSAIGSSGFGTVDHDLHRARRAPVARFFSRSMITRLEGRITALAQKLCDKILAEGQAQAQVPGAAASVEAGAAAPAPLPFDVAVAYSNLATDVASGYCFGEGFGLLEKPGWYPNFRDPTITVLKPVFAFRFFPFLKKLTGVAIAFVDYLPEEMALFVRTMQIDIPDQVQKTTERRKAGIVYERPTVIEALLDSELSPEDKTPPRIADEALAVVGAGTETTSWALAVITYHLLSQPDTLQKLTQELKEAIDDPQHLPPWTVLEKLPYLSAVIQEGLRLSYGVAARTARVPTDEDLVYRGEWHKKPVRHVIPRGFAVGMSTVVTHHDERLFPQSRSFRPERWVEADARARRELDRGMLAFSKGSRACLGMNLALCEIYHALAALTLRVFPHMRLYETTEEDVRYDYDLFIPMVKRGSKGVRAVLV